MKRRSAQPSHVDWRRVVASGALWAVVYNFLWGIAWFAFMRREWLEAVVALGKPLPWTGEVWFIWVTFTVPLGIAVIAHAASGGASRRKATIGSIVVWLPFVVGMLVWGSQESFSTRVLVLDAVVNLFALVVAALIGAWSLGPVSNAVADAVADPARSLNRGPSGSPQ